MITKRQFKRDVIQTLEVSIGGYMANECNHSKLLTQVTSYDLGWILDHIRSNTLLPSAVRSKLTEIVNVLSTTNSQGRTWYDENFDNFHIEIETHLAGDFRALEANVSNLVTAFNNLSSQVTTMQSDLDSEDEDALKPKVSQLVLTMQQIWQAINDTSEGSLNAKLNAVKTKVETWTTTLNTVEDTVTTVSVNIAREMRGVLDDISDTLAGALGEEGTLANMLRDCQEDLITYINQASLDRSEMSRVAGILNDDLSLLLRNLSELNSHLTNLTSSESELSITSDNVLLLRSAIAGLETKLSRYVNQIADLSNMSADIQAANHELAQSVDSMKNKVQESVGTLTANVNELHQKQDKAGKMDLVNTGINAANVLLDMVSTIAVSSRMGEVQRNTGRLVEQTKKPLTSWS